MVYDDLGWNLEYIIIERIDLYALIDLRIVNNNVQLETPRTEVSLFTYTQTKRFSDIKSAQFKCAHVFKDRKSRS